MKLFESIVWPEGVIIQFFGIFRIGIGGSVNPEDEQGPFTTLILGLWKLNCAISLEWRNNVNLDENTW